MITSFDLVGWMIPTNWNLGAAWRNNPLQSSASLSLPLYIAIICMLNNRSDQTIEALVKELWDLFTTYLSKHTNVESRPRITGALEKLEPTIRRPAISPLETLNALGTWPSTCSKPAVQIFNDPRAEYLKSPDATPSLGKASCRIYKYVREELAMPFFGEEFISSAEWEVLEQVDDGTGTGVNEILVGVYHCMGEMTTVVYQSMRSGAFYAVAVDCLKYSVARS